MLLPCSSIVPICLSVLSDLFKEQYDFKRQFKLKSTTSSGAALESTIESLAKGGDFAGGVKVNWKQPDVGTFETELHTSGSTKYSLKADHLSKGLTIKLSGDEKPAGKVETDYAQSLFSSSITVDASRDATSADFAGVVGFDGLSVGGHVKADISAQKVSDFNAGAEYSGSDFTVTVKTTDQTSKLGTGYFHKLSSDLTVGALFSYDVEKGSRTLTVGDEYQLGGKNLIKAKVDTNGILSTAIVHRVGAIKAGLAFETNIHSGAKNYGLTLSYGDE